MACGCIAIHHCIVTWWLWVCSGWKCIAAWGRLGEVYYNRGWLGWGKLCHNTRNCIVTNGLLTGLVSRYN